MRNTLLLLLLVGWGWVHLVLRPQLAYYSNPRYRWWWLWSNWCNKIGRGNRSTRRNSTPVATMSATNPTWPDPGSNAVRRGGKPATNRLSCGTAYVTHTLDKMWVFIFLLKLKLGWYTPLKWRVLVRMIGFVSTLVHSVQRYRGSTQFTEHRCTRISTSSLH
jgi:hypothetical protein